MKNLMLVFLSLSIILFSCKSNEEKRVEQIGYDLLAYSDTLDLQTVDLTTAMIKSAPFSDVDELPYVIVERIKENGPRRDKIKVEVTQETSDAGVKLFTLQLNGLVRRTVVDFKMTIKLAYNISTKRFRVIEYTGGLGWGQVVEKNILQGPLNFYKKRPS
jgi:hypothetical protein